MKNSDKKSYVVLVGANFVNKGAEAMLWAAVEGLQRHFPTYEVVLLDLFPTLNKEERRGMPLRIVNMHVRSLFRINFPILKLLFKPKPISDSEGDILALFDDASGLMDLSGYGLSAHNQALLWSIAWLLPLRMAKQRKVPAWLLPQSLGPFNFGGLKKLLFRFFALPLLQYPEVVFAREPSGYAAVAPLRSKPTFLSPDMVLLTAAQDGLPDEGDAQAEVLVIPNQQLFRLLPAEEVLGLYTAQIKFALEAGYTVRVLRHSADDAYFCLQLARSLAHPALQIDEHLAGLRDLRRAISSCRFVVTGRYHGAVHALKASKPVLIIGWAEKYRHLAHLFGIENYLVDLSGGFLPAQTHTLLPQLIQEEQKLKHQLGQRVREMEADTLWSHIDLP